MSTLVASTRRPDVRIGALVVALVAITGALVAWALPEAAPAGASFHLPWWGYALVVAVVELLVVHIEVRDHAHTISFGELPLVFGLLLCDPSDLVIGQAVGDAVVLIFVARQSALKVAFNVANYALSAALAAAIFGLLAPGGAPLDSTAGLLAVAGAVVAAMAASVLAIHAVISIVDAEMDPRALLEAEAYGIAAAVANVALALAMAVLVWSRPAAAWLLLAPLAVLFVSYRAYASAGRRARQTAQLYETSQLLHGARDVDAAAKALVARLATDFRAGFAVTLLLGRDGGRPAVAHVVAGEEAAPSLALSAAEAAACVPAEASHVAEGAELDALRTSLRRPDLDGVLIAPLTGEGGRPLGALILGERGGDVIRWEHADVAQLDAVATTASVAFEREHLDQTLRDVRELQDQLEHQAFHDSLTGLANRSLFGDRVEEALGRAGADELVAVLFLDLDGFKLVNDTIGHHAGDELLVTVAARLDGRRRPQDTAARLGGDEFALLLEGLRSLDEARTVADRVLAALDEPVTIGGRLVHTAASIGIAFGRAGDTPGDLLRNADLAMYDAKGAGGRRTSVFSSGMHDAVRERLDGAGELRRALDRDELILHFQPIVDLAAGHISGAEALVRWQHPEQGLLPPGRFIPLAEESGLIVPLGRQVLQLACSEAASWAPGADGRELTLTVNLAARQLQDSNVADDIARALAASGLAPERLVVEVTEGVLMEHHEGAAAQLEAVRALGVRVAMDDFGTGHSSLARLDTLPVDTIKLARELVATADSDPDAALLAGALHLAGLLGKDVIAEGLETSEQIELLRVLGCAAGQGFGLARPMSASALVALVSAASPVAA